MTDKVARLEVVKSKPVESALRLLDEMRKEVESGKVEAIALVAVYRDGKTWETWGCDPGQSVAPILGGIEILKDRLLCNARP